MRDSKDFTAVCDEPAEITDPERDAARNTVAHYVARNGGKAADALEFMRILGIAPGQDGLTIVKTSIPKVAQ
jgi:hypothetical protein